MAGRGRRLGGYGEKDVALRRPGEAAVSPTTTGNINITVLIRKINEININNIDPIVLHETEILLKQLFVSGKAMKDIVSSLHSQALSDSDFGEKLMIALEQVSTYEVDDVCLRSEWLAYVQKDYELKETMSRSDSRKLANAVVLLGGILNVFKIRGKPITVLGCALIDYINLLVDSDAENLHQVLTTQVILNGNQIMILPEAAEKFQSVRLSLRKALITRNLTSRGKCWILLAIDYISNNMKPLSGTIREFYVENLGDNYLNLEARSMGTPPVKGSRTLSEVSPSSKSETESIKSNKSDDIFQDIENLNISNPIPRGMRSVTKSNKSEQGIFVPRGKRVEEAKLKQKKQGLDIKISTGRSNSPKSDEDFYGLQIEKKNIPDM